MRETLCLSVRYMNLETQCGRALIKRWVHQTNITRGRALFQLYYPANDAAVLACLVHIYTSVAS